MNFSFRLATPADAPAIHAIYAPVVEQTVISFELVPPLAEELAQRILATTAHYPWLVCESDGVVTGYAYASQHRARYAYQWAADVSVYIHAQWRRRGIGCGLYTALLALLRSQGYYGAFAGITLPNPGSVHLHEALGFTPLGVYHAVGYKMGAWHDVGWWEHRIQPLRDEPAPPLPIGQILGSAAWNTALAEGCALLR